MFAVIRDIGLQELSVDQLAVLTEIIGEIDIEKPVPLISASAQVLVVREDLRMQVAVGLFQTDTFRRLVQGFQNRLFRLFRIQLIAFLLRNYGIESVFLLSETGILGSLDILRCKTLEF